MYPPEFQPVFWEGGANVSGQVEIPLDDTFVTLDMAIERQHQVLGWFLDLAGVQNAGQWAVRRSDLVFVLCQSHIVQRDATPEEAVEDYGHFGEQVLGEEDPDGPLNVLGANFVYTGPQRIQRAIYDIATTVVYGFPTEDEMQALRQKVLDEVAQEGATAACFWSSLFATPQQMYVARTEEMPTKADMQKSGQLSYDGERLIFTQSTHAHDCTDALWQ